MTSQHRTFLFSVTSFILTSMLPLFSTSVADPHQEIPDLKAAIMHISEMNTSNRTNRAEIRASLQILVDRLVELTPERSEAEKRSQVLGGWRSLWSDMEFGWTTDYDQVYQVVMEDGYYYNIARSRLGLANFTNFLRGEFEDQGDFLRIEFTNNSFVYGFYPKGTNLVELVKKVESGTIKTYAIPGPIGVKGNLENTYVDETLRIVTGRSDSDEQDSMFVLVRTSVIE